MKTIRAKEGMFLTQKSVRKEEWRTFCKEVTLSTNDSEDNWRDAYADEKIAWDKEQEVRIKEKETRHGETVIQE